MQINSHEIMINTTYNSTTDSVKAEVTVKILNEELYITVLPVTIFIGIEAVVGFFGNILILFVYSKYYVHCNFRYFVLFLAIYDLTSCITTLPGEMFSQMYWYDYKYDSICKIKSYFNVFTAWGSAYTLLLLASDRFRKICRPHQWQIPHSKALKLCAVGLCLSSLVSIPITILWGKQTYTYAVEDIHLNVTVCEKSGIYANDIYPFVYVSCVYILPIGVMMVGSGVCNILIARKLFCKMTKPGFSNSTKKTSCRERQRRNMSDTSVSVIASERHTRDDEIQDRSEIRSSASLSTICLQDISRKSSSSNLVNCQENHQNISLSCSNVDTSWNQEANPSSSVQCFTNEPRARKERRSFRRKQKTVIMLSLTSVFIVTVTLYIALLSIVAEKDNILKKAGKHEKVVFFFFWRLYFINSVINPILYGVMDPRFRIGLKRLFHF